MLRGRPAAADGDDETESEESSEDFAWENGDGSKPEPSLTGNFRFHQDFCSRHLGNKRTLAVYLPPGYERKKRTRYPVIYFHDGQNVFDAATSAFGVEWEADESADRMIRAGEIMPVIMVGIYNSPNRMDEYTPHYDKRRKKAVTAASTAVLSWKKSSLLSTRLTELNPQGKTRR